jgi:hypothetical protein
MMLSGLLVGLLGLGAEATEAKALYVRVEVTPMEVRLGDILFLRVSLENRGDAAIPVPRWPSSSFVLDDPDEYTRYDFSLDLRDFSAIASEAAPGPKPKDVLLEPGQTRLVDVTILPLPSLNRVTFRFWNPKTWRSGGYCLRTYCAGVWGSAAREIRISPRPEEEMAALLEYHRGPGPIATPPPGWVLERPSLHTFHLLSFPVYSNMPQDLAAVEQKLSPGSLRDVVHATRLAAAVFDAKMTTDRRAAAAVLLRWLDERPEIQRQCMAPSLVDWAMTTKGLGEYSFEFIDQLIPRCPEASQQSLRKQNDVARRRYHGEVVPD